MPKQHDPKTAAQVAALLSAVSAVGDYKDRFQFGRGVAQALRGGLDKANKVAGLRAQGLTAEEAVTTVAFISEPEPTWADKQSAARAVLEFEFSEVLAGIGLGIEPTRILRNSVETVGGLSLQLRDGGKFVDFLDRAAEDGHSDHAFLEAVELIGTDWFAEVSRAVLSGDAAGAAEGLAYAGGVAAAMSRLGLSSSRAAADLRELSAHRGAGYEAEYFRAKQIGLLDRPGPGRFNPSTWHQDSTAESLTRKWGDVASLVVDLQKNPNASAFADQLVRNAAAHVRFARDDLATMKAENPGFGEAGRYGEGFDQVLPAVEQHLAALSPKGNDTLGNDGLTR